MEVLCRTDWAIATPIITFAIGSLFTFIVTYGKDYLDRKRRVNNLKYILRQELFYNYLGLVQITKKKEVNLNLTKSLIKSLSTLVFESYFNRLDSLEKKDLKHVYTSFYRIRDIKNLEHDIKNIMELIEDGDEVSDLNVELIIKKSAETSIESIKNVLLLLGMDEDELVKAQEEIVLHE